MSAWIFYEAILMKNESGWVHAAEHVKRILTFERIRILRIILDLSHDETALEIFSLAGNGWFVNCNSNSVTENSLLVTTTGNRPTTT